VTAVCGAAPRILIVAAPRKRAEVARAVSVKRLDRELVARLVGGEESALRETYRAYAPAVFGLAIRVLGNDALAQEVTQDVFVRLWEQPARFDPERGPLRAYLLAMTHSRAVERVRAEESQRRRREAVRRERVMNAPADPALIVTARADGDAVRNALAELPDDQRTAIEMAYFDGMSYREVADSLGEPEGTVKYRIRSGMQKMKAALQSAEVAP
jgi:RNA polymerase sigma-70 factor, ECF subfamily